MPKEINPEDELNKYMVYFMDGTEEPFFTKDKLIATMSKDDEGGYHNVLGAGDEWMVNFDNVKYIENVTPPPKEDK